MPETTQATTTTTETTEATTAPTETTEPVGAVSTTTETLDPARLVREREEARKQAAGYRAELKRFQDEKKAADEEKLSDEEKRIARIAELERTLSDRDLALQEKASYAAVVDAAARLGAAKPTMIHRLIASEIEYEDDGEPKNVEALVKTFLRDNPEFVSTAGRPTGDAGQGARGKSTLTRDQIKSMKPEEINVRWQEVQEVLKSPG